MTLPRSRYVHDGQEGVYHCFSRCVRRAFLYGFDRVTGCDFSHRKAWLVDRLRQLAAIFAIEVCAYAVMENHYHLILRTRPDIVSSWSDYEVATRWLTLFPRHRTLHREPLPPCQEDIALLASLPERIAELRLRLSKLSWFMGRLNEFIARAANKEDKVKGRFWESRFKCQALLDDAAIAACMVYVDLNLIRAGLAATPEASDFTSIQERIRAWFHETISTLPDNTAPQDSHTTSVPTDNPASGNRAETFSSVPDSRTSVSASWLCPISSQSQRRGILKMTPAEYFDLVDKSGRVIRSDKRHSIDADLDPILLRIGANPAAWIDTVCRFGYKFRLAAGLVSNLRDFAAQIGNRWLTGIAAARTSFALSPQQLT